MAQYYSQWSSCVWNARVSALWPCFELVTRTKSRWCKGNKYTHWNRVAHIRKITLCSSVVTQSTSQNSSTTTGFCLETGDFTHLTLLFSHWVDWTHLSGHNWIFFVCKYMRFSLSRSTVERPRHQYIVIFLFFALFVRYRFGLHSPREWNTKTVFIRLFVPAMANCHNHFHLLSSHFSILMGWFCLQLVRVWLLDANHELGAMSPKSG